jgi:hypothetical protein
MCNYLHKNKSKLFPLFKVCLASKHSCGLSERENNRHNKGNEDGKTHISFHEKRKQVQKISPTTTVETFYSSEFVM